MSFSTLLSRTAEFSAQIIDDISNHLDERKRELRCVLDGWLTWDDIHAMMKEYKKFSALYSLSDKAKPVSGDNIDFHIEMNLQKTGVTRILHDLFKYHLGHFLDDLFGIKIQCRNEMLDELRRCVRTSELMCPTDDDLTTSEMVSKDEVAQKLITLMHNLDIATVNEDKTMSDEILTILDAMSSRNEIDFYIIWVIEIEERIDRIQSKEWVSKQSKMQWIDLANKIRDVKINVDDPVGNRIKATYMRKGLSRKDTIENLTNKYKVDKDKRPDYTEWIDEQENYNGRNKRKEKATIDYASRLIKKKRDNKQ